jgi:hypothetical protein
MHVILASASDRTVWQIDSMLRQPDSVFLGIAALLISAGLLTSAVPATRLGTAPAPAPLAVDFDCPYAELVIISEPVA